MRRLMLIFVLVMCGAAEPAGANPIDDAVAAYNKRDFATALRLLQPLADQGDAEAQNNLGIMYRNGQGVPRDHAAALTWFHRAAEQDEPAAQLNLGLMYYFGGEGVPKDYAMAMTWFRKAAEHGQAHAQAFLGLMYREGQSVPQDYVQAHMWFSLAASRFGASASERQAAVEASKDRADISAKMTPAQIAEAQKLAREWKPVPRK